MKKNHEARHRAHVDNRGGGRHIAHTPPRPTPLKTPVDWLLAIGAILFLTCVAACAGTAITLFLLTLI